MDTTTREYAWCKACGNIVYREGAGPWMLADMADQHGRWNDILPTVTCGCND